MLCLLRHGAAGEARTDRERELTNVGRSEVTALKRALEGRGVRFDRILHSGFIRARQTAELLEECSDSSPVPHDGISPDDDPDLFVAELDEMRGSTLVVSHLPFLPSLCEELLEEISALPQFRTATLVCLQPVSDERGPGKWRLAWYLNGRDEMLKKSEG